MFISFGILYIDLYLLSSACVYYIITIILRHLVCYRFYLSFETNIKFSKRTYCTIYYKNTKFIRNKILSTQSILIYEIKFKLYWKLYHRIEHITGKYARLKSD